MKVVSVAVVVLLLTVVGASFASAPPALGSRVAAWAFVGVVAGTLAALAFMVRGYEVEADAVNIVRPGWRTRIPLAGLEAVEADPALLRGSLRLMGNGGFFSITGWFWNRRLGRYRLFANDGRLAVLLRFPDRRVVVTPGDPGRFAAAVREAAGLSDGGARGDQPATAAFAHGRA